LIHLSGCFGGPDVLAGPASRSPSPARVLGASARRHVTFIVAAALADFPNWSAARRCGSGGSSGSGGAGGATQCRFLACFRRGNEMETAAMPLRLLARLQRWCKISSSH